ncbi:MAG: hypothetical protein NTW10_05425 [Bacteroidetes bacterium]|nr:hypothetical protein [Bacteroidota bacterium]
MNTNSKLKVFKSNGYEYLYVYFKLGKNILRIPTNEKIIKGKMMKDLLFSTTVDNAERKNRALAELKQKVDDYIAVKSREYYPVISQTECKKFLQERYMRGDLMSGKRYIPLAPIQVTKKTLTNYVEDYIQHRKKNNTPRNTLKEFTTLLHRLTNFDIYKKSPTYLADINMTWSDDFEAFLTPKYQSGTIEKTYTILITVLYHYYERKEEAGLDLTDKFTIKNFKRGTKSRNMANPLTIEQFKTLYKHKFDEDYLEKTRIRFCLQCSTGLRFGDIHRITPEMINSNRIIIEPAKTKKYEIKAVIDMNQYSKKILELLDYNTKSLKIENAPYNRNIKAMFKVMQEKYPDMKYQANYGSHNGRDTFISTAVQAGVDYKTILIWTGQSSYSIMDRYIKPTDEYKAGQMSKVFDK